jgi:hypothetical protein
MSRRIKERCLDLEPELLPPNKRGGTIDDLEVVQEAVGLRPTREGGIRIEADIIGAHSESACFRSTWAADRTCLSRFAASSRQWSRR